VTRVARRYLPPLAWMTSIFVISAQPSLPHAPEPWIDLLLKKGGHALAYGILAWLYLRALRGGSDASDQLRLVSLLLAITYAITDELHQAYVPGRHPSLFDVLIDGTGATLALALERLRAQVPAPASR
jgi:VanZ family protein